MKPTCMASPPEHRTTASRRLTLVLGGAGLAVLVWLLGVWPPPVWWRRHWPRCTAMMRQHAGGSIPCPAYRPAPLSEISPLLQRMVIIGEDSRFRTHYGIDPVEIADALQLDGGTGLPRTIATAWPRRHRLPAALPITHHPPPNTHPSSPHTPPSPLNPP